MNASPGLQKDFSSWVAATHDPSECRLGVDGFRYEDLYDPGRLGALGEAFDAFCKAEDPAAFEAFEKYRACKGQGMTPEQTSEALLAAAPLLGLFVARLFRVEGERVGQLNAAK